MAGNLDEARRFAREELAILETLGNESYLFFPLHMLAYADYIAGDDDAARQGFERNLELVRRLGMRRNEAQEMTNLGSVETRAGNLQRADELCREVVRVSIETGSDDLLMYSIVNMGGVAAARGG